MTDEKPAQTELTINYIKSQNFREVGCDGVVGGTTPRGKLWCAFFTERFALPKVVKYPLHARGPEGEYLIDEEEKRIVEAKEGIVRNIEFGVYLSIDQAENLKIWLTEEIEKARQGNTP